MSGDYSITAKYLAGIEKITAMEGVAQESSTAELEEWSQVGILTATRQRSGFTPLDAKVRRGIEEEKRAEQQEAQQIVKIEEIDAISEQYEQKNPELQLPRPLRNLREQISHTDTKESILRKVLAAYSDVSLADEALDYLIETADTELAATLKAAKEDLNASHGREVRAGRNMGPESRAFAAKLGPATELRDLYRDITGNPREPIALFQELTTTYTYEKMNSAISFLLKSLGSDLRSKGPSIERAELQRLLTDARSLQAILGVYRFFQGRMRLIAGAFIQRGMLIPMKVTFDSLSKLFVKLLAERYPSAEKVLQLADHLGILDDTGSQMIVYTQMRDGVRGVSGRLFRSNQHRQDILMSFIEALEDLEEELEEEEEERAKKKKSKK